MQDSIDIQFPRVEYDLDRATLRPESKDSLNFLFTLLSENPSIVIELAAHTDSRGTDEHNLKLSQERAIACYKYLVDEKKINSKRIIPTGYGKKHLLISDETIAKMNSPEAKEAAHQKNRRTVIRVKKMDFIDPQAKGMDRTIVPRRKGTQEEYGTGEGEGGNN
jgi:outer membrane protein OmpA-like peptidoglycan-associated protein